MTFLNIANPLLECIPSFSDFESVIDAIRKEPLKNININSLNIVERVALLNGEKVILNPIKLTLRTVMTWYGMLVTGLHNRNPLIPAHNKIYYEILSAGSFEDLKGISPSGISVNVVKGPAGTGKTVTINGFCEIFPQAIIHGENNTAGWKGRLQLVWLHVNLPHDGTRRGFLTSILQAIDSVLKTSYSIDLPKQNKTVETLAVATIRVLISHYTGIMFIDEAQLLNLTKGAQAEVMQLFILQLMNIGIPIVISGNERALDWLIYSQGISRANITETAHFRPIGAMNEPGWQMDWIAQCDNGFMRYYTLEGPIQDFEGCSKALYYRSGGIARLGLILWCQAQLNCIYEGRDSVCPQDIEDVYFGPSFTKLRPLADGFRYKSAHKLRQFPDVDADFYEAYWKSSPNESTPTTSHKSMQSESMPEAPKRILSEQAKFKGEQTRQRNRKSKSEQILSKLGGDDMRLDGLKKHNLEQLMQLNMNVEEKDEIA